MRVRTTEALITLALSFLSLPPSFAQQESAERTRIFAVLPNWTGLWEAEPAVPGEVGGLESLSPELKGRLSRYQLAASPPYNAQWGKRQERSRADVTKIGQAASLTKGCTLGGFPQVMDSPTPEATFEALVTPEETLFVFPDGEVRHVYTDGRAHPKPDDLWPTAIGDSVGHWDGDTLVVDTIARKPGQIVVDAPSGSVAELSDRAHFSERIRRLDADSMQDDLTIDDPLRFSHPWRLTVRYRHITDLDRMIETNCTENDRNPVVKGHYVIAPP